MSALPHVLAVRASTFARRLEPLEQAPAVKLLGAGGTGELGQLSIGGRDDGIAYGALFQACELLLTVLVPQLYGRRQPAILAAQQSCYGEEPLAQAALRHAHLH